MLGENLGEVRSEYDQNLLYEIPEELIERTTSKQIFIMLL